MAGLDHGELEKLNSGAYNTMVNLVAEFLVEGSWLAHSRVVAVHVGDFVLMELLAGSCTGKPRIRPRGFPQNISTDAFLASHHMVVEASDALKWAGFKIMTADRYRECHASRELIAPPSDGFPVGKYLCHPDIHTTGYLTRGEVREVMEHHDVQDADLEPLFQAVLAALDVLADRHEDSRVVFWFEG